MSEEIRISVAMSVYDTKEEWLREAVESILNQTLSDFEFIIVLDCPTDGSDRVIREYAEKDKRIRVIQNEENIGLTRSLNRALDAARGKYIARMDADDISTPDRFEKEYAYMESHPTAAAVGARFAIRGGGDPMMYDWSPDQELTRIRCLFYNAGIAHPSAMIRRSLLLEKGIRYTESIKKSQDYKLWTDLLPWGDIVMLPDVLLVYRQHEGQVTADLSSVKQYARQVAAGQAEKLLGPLTEHEKTLHCTVIQPEIEGDDVKGLAKYLDRVARANREKKLYDPDKLERELDYMWLRKAARRLVRFRKADMLFRPRTLRFFKPGMIRYFRENKRAKAEYVAAMRRFEARA